MAVSVSRGAHPMTEQSTQSSRSLLIDTEHFTMYRELAQNRPSYLHTNRHLAIGNDLDTDLLS